MERPTPSDMMPKRDHERDVELDKKIEALRRKNEALMKRYQEVEEDRKRAEEEGMALQSRKGKADDLTITISKSTSDTRVVVTKLSSGGSSTGKGQQDVGSDGGDGPQLGLGRGRRKQLTVTMAGKKGKRVVSEKTERRPGPVDFKNSTDDGQARRVESAGRGKQPTHMTKRDTAAQEEVRQAQKQTEEHHRPSEHDQEFESQQAGTDLTIPTSIEEQEEYLRWKREREQIDRERVARHKNAKGQWRRAWDMDKTENMFSDKSLAERDRGPSSRGGRNARRGHPRSNADSRGHDIRGKEKGAKNVPVVSSKAKGKDRLTGRARRWGANEEETAHLQTSETTLEEFLEQLDALTDAEVEDHKHHDPKTETSESPDTPNKSDEAVSSCDSVAVETSSRSTGLVPAANPGEDALTQGKAEASSPRASEKKVRFSEELIQGARHSASTGAQDSACTESRGQSSLKASPPSKLKHEEQEHLESAKEDNCSTEDQGEPSAPVAEQQQVSEALIASETACTKKDTVPPTIPSSPPVEKASASPQEDSVQLGEIAKCNISNTNTEELIDSNLSVLSLESGETHPVNSTSSDKARENGKIV